MSPSATKSKPKSTQQDRLVITTIRLPRDLKEWLEDHAERDGGRSASSVIRSQLEQLRDSTN